LTWAEAGKTNEVNERMLNPVIKKLKPEAREQSSSSSQTGRKRTV
jgi:hypothetical protein